jgi:sporulation protein YlmC with PRC-barrel domain
VTASARLELGTAVHCSDGPFGELADVVIDPIGKRVTHLVVKPRDRPGLARLVPVDIAEGGAGQDRISLRCTCEEAAAYVTAQESAFIRMEDVPKSDPDWDMGVEDVLAMPYYTPMELGVYPSGYEEPVSVTYDRVPKGEVEIRRSSAVYSADEHHLGHVEAFLVDADAITHIVLERGHLWGKRDVTIPMSAVAKVETDTVTLSLSEDEVGGLPSIRVHRWK